MDTRWIQDFVTLAEVRNFTRAAEIRHVSQAAFSRRIQALEQWLGASLIDRTAFPLRLTEAGEHFRSVAVGLLDQIADVKAEVGGEPGRNHLRIAMPYVMATTRLPAWWKDWARDRTLSCSVEIGHVHDTVSAFAAGAVDLLVCYQQASHPVQLDPARFDRHEIGAEVVRPYASPALLDTLDWPGTPDRPVPLLMYTPPVYFARVVDTAIDSAPQRLHGTRVMEVAMSDVLGDLAQQGLGVAWLPASALASGRLQGLVPVGDGHWDIEVSVVAWRARSNTRRAVSQVWDRITAG